MYQRPRHVFCLVSALLVFFCARSHAQLFAGMYRGDDGGVYRVFHITPVGQQWVAWIGEGPQARYANIFIGRAFASSSPAQELTVRDGQWWDVPLGRTANAGSGMVLLMQPTELRGDQRPGSFRKIAGGGPFGGSRWQSVPLRSFGTLSVRKVSMVNRMVPRAGALTDVWLGDNGIVYYVREAGNQVAWFGESCHGPGANFFVGTRSGQSVDGALLNIVSNSRPPLQLRVAGPDRLDQVPGPRSHDAMALRRVNTQPSAIPGSLEVSEVIVRIVGAPEGDGLRSGSDVSAAVLLADGRVLPGASLNSGQGSSWFQGEKSLPLPRGTHLADIEAIKIYFSGVGRDLFQTYDNWDVAQISAVARGPAGEFCVAREEGFPLVRFTGERKSFVVRAAFPWVR